MAMTDETKLPWPKTTHLRVSISGFLRNSRFPRDYIGIFSTDDGRDMTPDEAHAFLLSEIAKGHKFIPVQGCDNFDPVEHGCLGHTADGKPWPKEVTTNG